MSVVHGTAQRPLPTGARIAMFDLLLEGFSPERQRYPLANPAIPAGQPIRYGTSAQFGFRTPGVMTFRPGAISFPDAECAPRNPGSVPVLATTVAS